MITGILLEPAPERRVSLLPEQAETLIKKNISVLCETHAGKQAGSPDIVYTQKGVTVTNRTEILQQADLILSIHPLSEHDLTLIKPNAVLMGIYQPLYKYATMKLWAGKGLATFSMDMIPRTTRAQSMDVLSSQANIAGYKAILTAASIYPKYFPMLMTAAGSVAPAKVLILGAGVAGLQAVATARRLGAVVEVFDTRPQVKEEVMSLGAKFVEVEGAADASKAGGYAVEQTEEYKQKQQQRIAEAAAKADVIITTAQIPGKPAPLLITEGMLENMKYGSVIIDIAAATGGNTAKTVNEQTIQYNGVTIVGDSNLPSSVPSDASKMYGKNVLNFLQLIITKTGELNLNFDDDIVKGTCITYNGAVVNDRVKGLLNGQ